MFEAWIYVKCRGCDEVLNGLCCLVVNEFMEEKNEKIIN